MTHRWMVPVPFLGVFALVALTGCVDLGGPADPARGSSALVPDDDTWAPTVHVHGAPGAMTDADTQRLWGQPFDRWAGDDSGVDFFLMLDDVRRLPFAAGSPAVNDDSTARPLGGAAMLISASNAYKTCSLRNQYRTHSGYSGVVSVTVPADASSGTYHEALDRVVVNWRWLTDEPGYYTDRENFAILYFRIGAGAWTELGRTSCESCPWWTSVASAVPGARPGDRVDLMAYYQMTLRSRFCHNTRKTVLLEVAGVDEALLSHRDGYADIPSGLDPGTHHVNFVVVDHDDDLAEPQVLPHGAGTYSADALFVVSSDYAFSVTDDDAAGPSIAIEVPATGRGAVGLAATASDATSGVDSVAFYYADGGGWTPIGTDGHDTPAGSSSRYAASWTAPRDGTFTIRAVACDLDADRPNDSACREATATIFACDAATDCFWRGTSCLSDGQNAPECADVSTRLACRAGDVVAESCGTDFCSDTGGSHGGGACAAADYFCSAGDCHETLTAGTDACGGDADRPSVTFHFCEAPNRCASAETVEADACADTGSASGGGSCAAADWSCAAGVLARADSSGVDSCGDPRAAETTYFVCGAADGAAADRCVPVPDTTPPVIRIGGPSGYIGSDGVVTASVADVCDSDPTVTFAPGPDRIARSGLTYTATYVAEGFYLAVTASAADDSGNRASAAAADFAIDRTAPSAEYTSLPTAGVDPADPSSWPAFFSTDNLPLSIRAFDAGVAPSGLFGVQVVLDPAAAGSEVLVSEIFGASRPLGGGPLEATLDCSHADLCTGGALDLGAISVGDHRIEITVQDVAGNDFAATYYFRVEYVPVSFALSPSTLNLTSLGNWVSGRIEGPDESLGLAVGVDDIVAASIVVHDPYGGSYPIDLGGPYGVSMDGFDFKTARAAIEEGILAALGWSWGDANEADVEFSVEGEFAGTPGDRGGSFRATDVVRIINRGTRPTR